MLKRIQKKNLFAFVALTQQRNKKRLSKSIIVLKVISVHAKTKALIAPERTIATV
jgi:hypothetical protein